MKYVLITGASTGIGYATASYLIEKGYFVFGSVRRQEDASRLSNELGTNFRALIFDVREEEAIEKARQEVTQIVGEGGLAGLINNAGIVVHGPLKHLPVKEFERQFEVNVFGVLKVTQAFLSLLGAKNPNKAASGKIINISSVSALFTNPFLVPYCASKAALESITDGLRRELLIYGIDVISIQPGPVKTAIWEKAGSGEKDYEETDYGSVMRQTNKLIAKAEARAIDAKVPAKLIHKILVLKHPKTRYILANNRLQIMLSRILPDRWIDGFFKKMMNRKA